MKIAIKINGYAVGELTYALPKSESGKAVPTPRLGNDPGVVVLTITDDDSHEWVGCTHLVDISE